MHAAKAAKARAVVPKAGKGTRRAVAVRAAAEEAKAEEEGAGDLMADLGLGELSEVMEKAEGGAAVPAWVPDVPQLKESLKFLAGTDGAAEVGNKILIEKARYGRDAIALVAEVTLALLLFSDAARIDTRNDSTSLALPARLLGIGLPLAQEIARAHGGEIEVESAPGRGSSFRVRLPRATN